MYRNKTNNSSTAITNVYTRELKIVLIGYIINVV